MKTKTSVRAGITPDQKTIIGGFKQGNDPVVR
jgi:hypothetical protein